MSGEGDINVPEDSADDLRIQKQHLLAELAMAYQQLEQVMLTAKVERDITYRELRSRNEVLQRKLSELEETHDQLREAQKMLVRGERLSAMGQMAAAIVHDINTPLAVIMGHAELMLMRETEAWKKEGLGAIGQAVERLRDLSANMLNLSDKSQTLFQTVDINELAEEVLTFLSPLTQHAIRTDLGGNLPRVEVNSGQLEQVLTNFIVNALDATEGRADRQLEMNTGCQTLSALISREEADGRQTNVVNAIDAEARERKWVYVEVNDNGTGMSGDQLTRIFEVFYTTKGDDGTGLGLAISKRIVEEQQGAILVSSSEGGGSSFKLLLPVERE